jgi:hypothetical protein
MRISGKFLYRLRLLLTLEGLHSFLERFRLDAQRSIEEVRVQAAHDLSGRRTGEVEQAADMCYEHNVVMVDGWEIWQVN